MESYMSHFSIIMCVCAQCEHCVCKTDGEYKYVGFKNTELLKLTYFLYLYGCGISIHGD